MNAIQEKDGHSTSSVAIRHLGNAVALVDHMKTLPLLLMITLMISFSACRQPNNGQEAAIAKMENQATDTLNKPKVDIKVNRHYDEKGNMVGFDSTYSSYYSNIQGDTTGMDTLFRHFDSYFRKNHSLLFEQQFNDLFFRDSLLYPDFFHNDFFLRRYELNDPYLREMMQRMDSVKNNYYRDQAGKR